MRKIARIIVVLVLLLVVGYLIILNLPQASVKSRTSMDRMEAADIYADFIKDETEAENRYLGKVLDITGIIDDLYDDENDAPVILLRGDDGDPVAMITLETDQKRALENYSIGDEIVIKAMCSGALQEVVFTKGIVIK